MAIPIASQTIRRSQVSPGRLAIKAKEMTIPRMGTSGTNGVLKGRCSSGRRTRRIHTPPILLTDVKDHANIGMIQRGGSLRFALKAAEGLCISSYFFRQEFESDKTVETSVLSL